MKYNQRPGQLNQAWLFFVGSVVAVAVLIALLMWKPAEPKQPLVVYCAAGLRLPVQEAAKAYEAEYGIPVQLDFRGSNTLLSTIELAERGDLYIPADDNYIQLARDKKLVDEAVPLARMTPIIAVRKGNPKGIQSIQDLLDKDVGIVQADPERAAVGKLTQTALTRSKQWDKLKAKTKVFTATVNDAANDVKLGAGGIDAGIIWDALLPQYPDLDGVAAPELATAPAEVMVGLLYKSQQPAAARRFMRYLHASDKGLASFAKHGFEPVESEPWSDSIKVYADQKLERILQPIVFAYQEAYQRPVEVIGSASGQTQPADMDLIVFEGPAGKQAQLDKRVAELIPLTQGENGLSVGVTAKCVQPTAALHFARYLAARDRGLAQLAKQDFDVVEGDAWADQPNIRLHIGAMLRPAVEQTLKDFEQREGCSIDPIYNGCGILVGQMRTGDHPDAYFSCDVSFMTKVDDLFLGALDISANDLVIIVNKGNPKKIAGLEDLTRSDLKIGLAHEEQSAMGALTHDLLRKAGLYDRVKVAVNTPTGDLLVNQLRAGNLDAVIACKSNAKKAAADVDVVRIGLPDAVAVQPFAIGKDSKHKQLTARLLDALRTPRSRSRFEDTGFEWRVKE
ncbi:MAG: molybdate ABC transporter substrate-binding protein [Gemmataceae bacterium]